MSGGSYGFSYGRRWGERGFGGYFGTCSAESEVDALTRYRDRLGLQKKYLIANAGRMEKSINSLQNEVTISSPV